MRGVIEEATAAAWRLHEERRALEVEEAARQAARAAERHIRPLGRPRESRLQAGRDRERGGGRR